jgi:hypothetical protein
VNTPTFKELTPKGYNFGSDSNLVINYYRTKIEFFLSHYPSMKNLTFVVLNIINALNGG